MRTRSLMWCSLALVLMVSGMIQAAAAGTDSQAIAAAEHQWLKSQQTNNVELLAPLLADKVVYTGDDGKVFSGKSHGLQGHGVRPYGDCNRHVYRKGNECG